MLPGNSVITQAKGRVIEMKTYKILEAWYSGIIVWGKAKSNTKAYWVKQWNTPSPSHQSLSISGTLYSNPLTPLDSVLTSNKTHHSVLQPHSYFLEKSYFFRQLRVSESVHAHLVNPLFDSVCGMPFTSELGIYKLTSIFSKKISPRRLAVFELVYAHLFNPLPG